MPDARLIQDVVDLPNCLSLIGQLHPILCHLKNDPTGPYVSDFIPQEFNNVFPQFTVTRPNDDGVVTPIPGFAWDLYFSQLVPYIVGAIIELKSGGTRIYPAAPNPLADVTLGATGVAKTVGQLTLTKGRWAVFGKFSCNTQALTVSISNMDLSISETADTHNAPNLVRDLGSILGTSRNISAEPYFVDVTSGTKVIYAVMSATGVWTGASPKITASASELFAVKTGNL